MTKIKKLYGCAKMSHEGLLSGENHPKFGKHCTEETKYKIKKSNEGKKRTKKTKDKISESLKKAYKNGKRKLNEEELKNIAEKNFNDETKEKSRRTIRRLHKEGKLSHVGFQKGHKSWNKDLKGYKIHSDESKQKIRESNSNRIILDKTRKKMSEKRKLWKTPFKDTKIEIKIQDYLKHLHVEFITHYYVSEITNSYQCDILIQKQYGIAQKTIIECDGCYWHGCIICNKKIQKFQTEHIKRDKQRTKELIANGFRVIRLWEHDIKKMGLNDLKLKL